MATRVGVVMACDGEKEFSNAIKSATQAVRSAKTALESVKEQYNGNANSVEALTAKQKALARIQEELKTKEEAANAALKKSHENMANIQSQIDKYNKRLEHLKRNKEQLEAEGKQETKVYAEVEQAIREQVAVLSDQNSEMHRQIAAEEKYAQAISEVERDTAKLNREIQDNDKYLDEARNSADGCATSIDRFGNEVKQTEVEVRGLDESLDRAFSRNLIKDKVIDLATSALRRLGDALIDLAREAAEAGIEFEAEMSRVAAISGATGTDFDKLTAKAEELGRTSVYSATESASAMEQMALAGWKTAEILEGVGGVLDLAASSGMDISQAASYVSDNLNAWGESAGYATHMSDIMATAMSNSSMTTEDLGEAYAKSAATAHSFGYSIEDVTSVLMIMANQGKKGSEAGVALNAIMTRLSTNTSECADKLAAYGVNVYDSNGKMRSLSNILEDLSGMWGDLTQEEQNNLAKSIAGQRQFTALSMIMQGLSDSVAESGRSFGDYKAALEDCNGAAKEMSDVMLDNLKGDLTLAKDAVEGLAIAAYNYLSGPARGVVQWVTDAINGLTDAITPKKDEITNLRETAETEINNIKKALDNVDVNMDSAEDEAHKVSILGTQLQNLMEIENKSTLEKQRMTTIIQELDAYIPGLAKEYDEASGSLGSYTDTINDYIQATKEQLVLEAAKESISELSKEWLNSQMVVEDAQAYKEAVDLKIESNNAEIESLRQARSALETYWNAVNWGGDVEYPTADLDAYVTSLYESCMTGALGFDEYKEKLSEVGYAIGEADKPMQVQTITADALNAIISDLTANTGDLALEQEDANKMLEEAEDVASNTETKLDNLMAKEQELTESLAENATSAEESAEANEELAESLDQLAGRAEAAASSFNDGMANITSHYFETVEEIKKDIGNKVNLAEKFEYDESTAFDTMRENLQSQNDAMETYADNIATITSRVGKEITPEFLDYLKSMGMDGATLVRDIATALGPEEFRQEGMDPDALKQLVNEYTRSLDLTDMQAKMEAAGQLAQEVLSGTLGSTELEYTALTDNIANAIEIAAEDGVENGWNGLDDQVTSRINATALLCQALGVKIPDGLADGISDGLISPGEALGEMEGAIQGQIEGMITAAKEAGIDIPDSVSDGIEAGGQSLIDAYNTLLDLLAGYDVGEINVGEDLANDIADGLLDNEPTVIDAINEIKASIQEELSEEQGGNINLVANMARSVNEKKSAVVDAVRNAVTASIESAKAEAVTAVEVGEAAGDAMASGMNSKAGDVNSAGSGLASEGVSGGSTGSAGQYTNGLNAAAGYAAGIRANSIAAVNAAVDMAVAAIKAAANAQASASPSKKFKKLGTYASDGYALGISDNAKVAVKAAEGMANSTIKAAQNALEIHSPSKKFRKAVGQKVGEGFAFGIEDTIPTTEKAAAKMSNKVYKSASTWLEKYKKSHKVTLEEEAYFWNQVADHSSKAADKYNAIMDKISSKKVSAAKWATTAIADVLNYTEDGRTGEQKLKDTETFNSDRLKAAQTYINHKKILNSVSLRNEKAYWEEILKQLDKGTDAWYEVYEKIKNIKGDIADAQYNKVQSAVDERNILSAIDISKAVEYAKKNINSWIKQMNRSKEGSEAWLSAAQNVASAYDTYVSAASQYLNNLKVVSDVSLKDQINYWKKVLKNVKEGTQAWYDAQSQINNLRTERRATIYSNQGTYLDYYKTYYKVSEKAEMEYWDAARKKLKSGTKERIEADQMYIQARDNYYAALREADENYNESYQKIMDEQQSKIDELKSAYADAVESVKSSVLSSFSLFEAFDSTGYDADTLLYNLQTQVAGLALWEEQMMELEEKGLSEGLLNELKAMGPSAAASIYSLNQMTAEQLAEYDRLWQERDRMASSWAERESDDAYGAMVEGIQEASDAADEAIAALISDYDAAIADITGGMSDSMRTFVSLAFDTGGDAVASFFSGMSAYAAEYDDSTIGALYMPLETSLVDRAEEIGADTLAGIYTGITDSMSLREGAEDAVESIVMAMRDAAGIHSPSTLFRDEIGEYLAEGMIEGFRNGTEGMVQAAKDIIDATINAAYEAMEERLNELNLIDDSKIAELNALAEQTASMTPVVNVSNAGMNSILEMILGFVGSISGALEGGITLDDGTIVGRYQQLFSQQSAAIATRNTRGLL